jgi:cytochrome c oxidase subunit II
MRSWLVFFVLMTATLTLTSRAEPGIPAQSAAASDGVQVIEVTAKKYEFNPSPIRVKQGARVQLKITATDHAHGFKIRPYPEGAQATDSPGRMFSSPQSCQQIEKQQTVTIEFVAKTAGTYPFKCCTVCGCHHRAMKGELIVEPWQAPLEKDSCVHERRTVMNEADHVPRHRKPRGSRHGQWST